jgi:hypothetical protein
MSDCKHYQNNLDACNCTYEPCSRKGYCCECLHYHRKMGELPACYFSAEEERTFNRSISFFARQRSR